MARRRGRRARRFGAEALLTTHVIGLDKQGESYFAVDCRERSTGALFKVNVKTTHQELIYADLRVDVSDVLVHPTDHRVHAVQVNYDKLRWVAIDAKVKQDLEGISKLAEGVPSVESRTPDHTSWIAGASSPPPRCRSRRANSGCPDCLPIRHADSLPGASRAFFALAGAKTR